MPLQSIPTYATGDTIEASWANTLRDNATVLDNRTGGDPGGANKWLMSTGSLVASWVDRATEVLAAIGYTPANKAGDTFTGSVTISGASSDLSVGRNIAATGGVSGATLSSAGAVAGVTGSFSGAVSAGGGYGAVAGTTGTFSGAVQGASLSSAGAIAATTGVSGASVSATGAIAGASVSATGGVSGGTVAATSSLTRGGVEASLVTHTHAPGDAATLDGIDSTGFTSASHLTGHPLIATGSYAGNDTAARQITTGFVCKYVRIQAQSGSVIYEIINASQGVRVGNGTLNYVAAVKLHASNGFVIGASVGEANTTGTTYHWIAFG